MCNLCMRDLAFNKQLSTALIVEPDFKVIALSIYRRVYGKQPYEFTVISYLLDQRNLIRVWLLWSQGTSRYLCCLTQKSYAL